MENTTNPVAHYATEVINLLKAASPALSPGQVSDILRQLKVRKLEILQAYVQPVYTPPIIRTGDPIIFITDDGKRWVEDAHGKTLIYPIDGTPPVPVSPLPAQSDWGEMHFDDPEVAKRHSAGYDPWQDPKGHVKG